MGPDGHKWGQEDFFPTNPDPADVLGGTDFDFENFIFWIFWVPTPCGPWKQVDDSASTHMHMFSQHFCELQELFQFIAPPRVDSSKGPKPGE